MKNGRICAQIDVSAFVHNLDEIKKVLAPGAQVCAVVKTDGYGHGALPLSAVMESREEIWGYAVATAQEAYQLLDAGRSKPILILGYVFSEDIAQLVQRGVRPTIFSYALAKEFSDAAVALGATAKIHIKLDSGMNRIGFLCDEAAVEEIKKIAALPNLEIEGIFTHFAKADEKDKSFCEEQARRFFFVVDALKEAGIAIPMQHMANSAAILDLPKFHLDLVRGGIILYGLYPSAEVGREAVCLQPVLSLKSHVVHVKTVAAGETISYGGTCLLKEEKKIATIPVGYGDGYPRALSNKGWVLIRGAQAPICGRICMDQFMVDVSHIPDVAVGDCVTLVGKDGAECITMEQIGALSGRFHYEFACDLGKRIPREYI